MKCDETRAVLLSGVESAAADEHLSVCNDCRAVSSSLFAARDQVAEPVFWEEPSAGLEDRVVAAILEPSQTSDQDITTSSAEVIELSFWRRALVPAMSVAAAFVLIVGATSFLNRQSPPDWEAVMLSAAGIDATGSVAGWNQDDGGTRVLLEVEGLAPAPEGFLYQLWFSDDNQHVSAGTFREATEVKAEIGVSRTDFPRVWITLEPVGEAGPPNGEVVMDTEDWSGL